MWTRKRSSCRSSTGPVKAFQITSGGNTLLSFHIYWLESGILL